MVSPSLVAALTIVGIVLLIAPMLALTLVGARDGHTPPVVDEDVE